MKSLYIQNTDLARDKRSTYISADATAGTGTLTVQSIFSFAINQILLIGEFGNEKSEIIKIHAVTAPSGTTITLASNLVFDHPQDTKVYIIDFDQIEVSWASTTSGSKTVLSASTAVQADQLETLYNETTKSSGYYFTRFKESIGGTFSDYSDPIPYSGYTDNTVFSVKKRAIDSIEWSNDFKTKDGAVVTDEFLNEALWEGRREYHFSPGKRPFRKIFNASIGTISTGMYRVLVPSDLESPYTAENVYGVRIGAQQNMDYYDKKQWDADYQSIGHSTLTTAYAVGNQDLYVSNAREFNASGSVNIEGDTISYSAVGFGSSSGGTLRISVAGTSSHATNSDVWQGTNFGLPLKFAVFSESAPTDFNETGSVYIYFSCPLSSSYVNQDIFGDYYRKLVERDSDADILDEPQYDMFVPYLAWRIKKRKAKGSIGFDDPDFQLWTLKKSNALAKEFLGAEVRIRPDVGHLTTPSEWA